MSKQTPSEAVARTAPTATSRVAATGGPPSAIVSAVVGVVNALEGLQRSLQPGFAVLNEYIAGGFLASRVVYVVAELGVADLLAAGPQTSAQLAATLGVNDDALQRILRAAVSLGIFLEREPCLFATNSMGRHLESHHPNSMRSWARYVGAPWHQSLWTGLVDSVRTGQDLYRSKHGRRFFEHFAQERDEARVFDEGMTGLSALSDAPIASAAPLRGCRTVVDVAGGLGGQLASILTTHPKLLGVLFDQPSVIDRARARWQADFPSLLDRVEFVGGDFFHALPPNADAYLMKSIIHDWEDERAAQILAVCRAAMGERSKLWVAELVLPSGSGPHFGKLLDVAMLALTGGRERTLAEYRVLMDGMGLRQRRLIRTASPYALIEAVRK